MLISRFLISIGYIGLASIGFGSWQSSYNAGMFLFFSLAFVLIVIDSALEQRKPEGGE